MKTGVYKIVNKKSPKEFYIIGAVQVEKHFAEYDPAKYEYVLLRETIKMELPHYTEHFKERFCEVSKTAEVNTPEDNIPEPVIETAVVKTTRKKTIRKKK